MDEVFTLQEVADKLKVSVQSITKVVKSGKMKSVLVGRQYRITETFLNEYLQGIFGDIPVEQTRAVNPSEKVDRKPNTRGQKSIEIISVEPVPQEIAKVDQQLGIDMFPNIKPVEKEEPIKLILKLKAEGMTYRTIAEHLNSLGIKTENKCDWTKDIVDNNIRKYKKSINE